MNTGLGRNDYCSQRRERPATRVCARGSMAETSNKKDQECVELYRKYRPVRLKDVVGQDEVVGVLQDMLQNGTTPHALLLIGPSGVGKTSISRILRDELNCSAQDFCEINAASSRGIDTIRDIQSRIHLNPFAGSCRIWYMDECAKLSGDAQTALLKTLEDIPSHVYFILATTDPQKLIRTVRTRCTELVLKSLGRDHLYSLLTRVATKENAKVSEEVLARLVDTAEGSARLALVNLHKVIHLSTEEERLQAILPPRAVKDAFEVVRKLIWQKRGWEEVAKTIDALDADNTDWEMLRRLVKVSAANELLKNNKNTVSRSFLILDNFVGKFFDTGKSGRADFVKACYDVVRES